MPVSVRCGSWPRRAIPIVTALALWCGAALGATVEGVTAHKGLTDNSLETVTAEQLPGRIADFKALGVSWVRYELDWSAIQPSGPGTFELRQQDMVIKALTEAGIHVVGLLDYTPGWANKGAASKYHPPADPAAFAAFAAHMVRRYSASGVRVWEVWNEQNSAAFWGPAANVADYAVLLKHTYIAIHEADPGATVLTGGLAQPWDRGGDISALRFLQELYDAGAAPYFDAVSTHPYFSPDSPTNNNGNNWQKLFRTTPSVLGTMAKYGDRHKTLWITEVGAPTGGTDAYGTVISEEAQAAMLRQIYAFAADPRYPRLGPIFWYNYLDFAVPPGVKTSSECCFGLRRADGQEKPAYRAYKDAPASRLP